jgi:hypothetical protein
MASETKKLTVKCPGCEAALVIDAATGEVLSHREKKEPLAGGRDFDSLFDQMKQEKSQAEELFEREVNAFEDRERLLEEKFEEAMKRAKEEPEDVPPPRPFDLD